MKDRKEYFKKYYAINKERIKQTTKKWNQLHKESRKKYVNEWKRNNREKIAPKEKEYREKHKEHYKELGKKYQQEHGKEQTRKHYEKHKEQRKESSRKKSRELTKWMDEIKTGMGCSICGDNEFGFLLEFHHLNGDKKIGGHQLRFIYHGNQRYFDELEKCMLLCRKCHRIVHRQERHYNEPEWVIKYNEYITRFNK